MNENAKYYHQFILSFSGTSIGNNELIIILDDREIIPFSLLKEHIDKYCNKLGTWAITSHVVLLNE